MSNRFLRILFQFKYHLNWENNNNLCWLNSSMSILAHNKTLQSFIFDNRSQIATIVKGYESIFSFYNDSSNEDGDAFKERKPQSLAMLKKIQTIVLDYLKPILKYKDGEPDSAFCCLLNLIKENEQIKNLFLVEYFSIRHCRKCAVSKVSEFKKTIITLQKVPEFNPASPVSLFTCHICKSEDQTLQIKYKTLPRCLIFHFENVPQVLPPDTFEINTRKYELSGFIELKTILNMGHFVTWIRDIASDTWLERNDLRSFLTTFLPYQPGFRPQGLYIAMYEALDNNKTISCASAQDIVNISRMHLDTNSSCADVVNLSDVENCENNQTENRASNLPFMESNGFEKDVPLIKDISVASQENVLMEESKILNIKEPINAAEDCLQDETSANAEKITKQSLLKDSISILESEEKKSFDFTNAVAAFFAKPENSGKTLVKTTSNTETQEINIKGNGFEKKDIPSNKDISVASQDAAEDCFQDDDESGANKSILSTCKKFMERFASISEETAVEKSELIESANFPEKTPVAIKEEKTYSKPFLKRKAEENDFVETKVRRDESLHKRPRKMKMQCSFCNECANTTGKAKLETVSKKNMKTQNRRAKKSKIRATKEVCTKISSTVSRKTIQKTLSDDIHADNDAKAGNSAPLNECSFGSVNKPKINPGYDVAGDTIRKRSRKMAHCRFCSDDCKVETILKKRKRAT